MYTVIKGKWLWNEDIWDKDENGSFQAQCLFVSNGQSFNDLAFSYNARWDYYSLIYTLQGSNEPIEAAWSDQGDTLLRFGEQEYRTIDFGAEGCPILEDAYYFILANAQPVYGIAEKLQYIAENTQRVYDKGYQEGNDAGYDEGLEVGYGNGYSAGELKGYDDGKRDGKTEGRAEGKAEGLEEGYNNGYQDGLVSGEGYSKAESDFWDVIQESGKRTEYSYAFAHWAGEYIRPKYKVVLTVAGSQKNIFYMNKYVKKIESAYFDFSQLPRGSNVNQTFSYCFTSSTALEEIEDIGLPISYSYAYAFAWCSKLRKIAMIRVDETTQGMESAFTSCIALESVAFEGVIGISINLQWSTKLTRASIENIITHLSDTATGKTLTLSDTAIFNAFTDEEWWALIANKPNWTIVGGYDLPLSAPTIKLSDTTLNIYDEEGLATSYDILVDGEVKATTKGA